MMKNKLEKYLFDPSLYVIAYFFFATTTLHHEINFLLKIHIEFILFITIILTVIRKGISFNDHNFWKISLFSMILILIPLISSVLNYEYASIINDGEYSTYFQTMILLPFLYSFLSNHQSRKSIYNIIVLSTFILSIYFEYRYLILNEIRDFDSRPLLKIRHGDANFLCTILSFAIPYSIYLIQQSFKSKKYWQTIFYIIMACNIMIATILTQSRMGLIALLIALGYLILKKEIKIRKYQVGLLITISALSFIFFGQSLTNRFENIADKSNADRVLTYINGFKIIKYSPYFGVGMHHAKDYFYSNTKYPNFQSEFHQLDIHNTYLKIFAELGFFAFLTLIIFLGSTMRKLLHNMKQDRYIIFSSFIILIISSLTIGIPYKDFYNIELIIILAMAMNKSGAENV